MDKFWYSYLESEDSEDAPSQLFLNTKTEESVYIFFCLVQISEVMRGDLSI